ncbi:hypothetical protein [Panacagrimonas perspica]|uniref:hypothetical protein n=1 Tax=Panacagrimonas perspica TaxID=381431 RepID=UPI0014464F2B|nr:hypothetical protein [Panacagrimonas perspica]
MSYTVDTEAPARGFAQLARVDSTFRSETKIFWKERPHLISELRVNSREGGRKNRKPLLKQGRLFQNGGESGKREMPHRQSTKSSVTP